LPGDDEPIPVDDGSRRQRGRASVFRRLFPNAHHPLRRAAGRNCNLRDGTA